MGLQPDFRELFALFNDHRVSYVIVGGYALAFHGAPLFTGDLDIFVMADHENAGCGSWCFRLQEIANTDHAERDP